MENLSTEEQQKRILTALEAAFNNLSIADALSALYQRKSTKIPPKNDVFPIKIDATFRKTVKDIYQRQASKDENFVTLLAMQKKYRFDVFQYLMTDFLRCCLRSHYEKRQEQGRRNQNHQGNVGKTMSENSYER